ncbi:MAG: TRAP transporter TatT component family protein [Thermoanaerobaculia bacterium]
MLPIGDSARSLASGLALAGLVFSGCSVRKLAINGLADALASAGDVYASDSDPELVEQALPFSLKTIEALLAESPGNSSLLLSACSGFTQYSYAFVQARAERLELEDYRESERQRDRALALFLRARDYCLRSLEKDHPGITGRLRLEPEAAAADLSESEIDLIYWTGASWGAAMSAGTHRLDVVADLPAVQALLRRVLALDERYDDGAVHEAMISIESLPEAMGGSPERARSSFDRAVELSGGGSAGPYVSLASGVVVSEQNRAEFTELLEKALAVDVDEAPERRLANLVAQRRARLLLERIDEYFIE